jgi:Beta-lactamase enzyme family
MNKRTCVVFALLLIILAASASGQTTEKPQTATLLERAGEVCAQFRAAPGDYEKVFAPDFLAQFTPSQLTPVFAGYFGQLGRCTKATLAKSGSPDSGEFEFIFEKGVSVPSRLSVNATAPNLITSLWFGNPVSNSATLSEIVAELKGFPGETSFLVVRLDGESMTPLVSHNAERELAIGSAFKLYVLSELVHELNANERKLSDVITLDERAKSLPSGMMQSWPTGSPVTLQTLATLMISISDNTAADHLLLALTRDRVEHILRETGHAKHELDMPFLSTLEMFKLKGEPTHKAADEYLALDVTGRRRFLMEKIANVKREDTKPYADGKPSYIDRIEWFASVTDLCHAMNWLRRQTDVGAAAPVRDILSINAGLNVSRERWRYIGFKGGSEPGVLNLTYLLQSTKGQWYAMSISWNNPQAALDNSKLIAIVERALQIIE